MRPVGVGMPPLTPYEASRARERRARVLAPKIQESKGGRGVTAEKTAPKLGAVSDRRTSKVAATGTGYSGSTLDKVDKIRDDSVSAGHANIEVDVN